MDKIKGNPPFRPVVLLPFPPSSRIVKLGGSKGGTKDSINRSDGFGILDLLNDIYELNKSVLMPIFSFFEALFSGGSKPKAPKLVSPTPSEEPRAPAVAAAPRKGVIIPFETAMLIPNVRNTPEQQLREDLVLNFPSTVEYQEGSHSLLGQYFLDHLLKHRQSVQFDPATKIYTLTFAAEKEIPLLIKDKKVQELLGDKLQNPSLRLAKEMKIKLADGEIHLGQGKIQFLDNCLAIIGTVKKGPLSFHFGASLESLADPNPLNEQGRLIASVALNKETNLIIRGFINTILCPLLRVKLNNIPTMREPTIQLIHQALFPKQRRFFL